jgi:hypothetical protein
VSHLCSSLRCATAVDLLGLGRQVVLKAGFLVHVASVGSYAVSLANCSRAASASARESGWVSDMCWYVWFVTGLVCNVIFKCQGQGAGDGEGMEAFES